MGTREREPTKGLFLSWQVGPFSSHSPSGFHCQTDWIARPPPPFFGLFCSSSSSSSTSFYSNRRSHTRYSARGKQRRSYGKLGIGRRDIFSSYTARDDGREYLWMVGRGGGDMWIRQGGTKSGTDPESGIQIQQYRMWMSHFLPLCLTKGREGE